MGITFPFDNVTLVLKTTFVFCLTKLGINKLKKKIQLNMASSRESKKKKQKKNIGWTKLLF